VEAIIYTDRSHRIGGHIKWLLFLFRYFWLVVQCSQWLSYSKIRGVSSHI
jgi:hypothetical protein